MKIIQNKKFRHFLVFVLFAFAVPQFQADLWSAESEPRFPVKWDFAKPGASAISQNWAEKRTPTNESIYEVKWVKGYKGRKGCIWAQLTGGAKYCSVGTEKPITVGKHKQLCFKVEYLTEKKAVLQLEVELFDKNKNKLAMLVSPKFSSDTWGQARWIVEVPCSVEYVSFNFVNAGTGNLVVDSVELISNTPAKFDNSDKLWIDLEVWPEKWNSENWNKTKRNFNSIHKFPVPVYFALKPLIEYEDVSVEIQAPHEVKLLAATERTPRGTLLDIKKQTGLNDKNTYIVKHPRPLVTGSRYMFNSLVAVFDVDKFEPKKQYQITCTPVIGERRGARKTFKIEFLKPLKKTEFQMPYWIFSFRPAGDILGFSAAGFSGELARLYKAAGMINIHPIKPTGDGQAGGYPETSYEFYRKHLENGWKESVVFYNALLVSPEVFQNPRLCTYIDGSTADPKLNKFNYQRLCPNYVLEHESQVIEELKKWNSIRNSGLVSLGQIAEIDYEPWQVPNRQCFCEVCIRKFCEKFNIERDTIKHPKDILEKYSAEWGIYWRDMIDESYEITVKAARQMVGKNGLILDYNYHHNLMDRNSVNYAKSLLSMPKDARGYDKLVWHLTSYYNYNSANGFDALEKQLACLENPVVPVAWIGMGSPDMSHYVNWKPEQWRLFIINTASAGCPFSAVYPGLCIDGKYFWYANLAFAELERVCEFYKKSQRCDIEMEISAEKPIRYRTHRMGGKVLFTIFNYGNKKSQVVFKLSDSKYKPASIEVLSIERQELPYFMDSLNVSARLESSNRIIAEIPANGVGFIIMHEKENKTK